MLDILPQGVVHLGKVKRSFIAEALGELFGREDGEGWIFARLIGRQPINFLGLLHAGSVARAHFMLAGILVGLIDENDMTGHFARELECRPDFDRVMAIIGVEVVGEPFEAARNAGECIDCRKSELRCAKM